MRELVAFERLGGGAELPAAVLAVSRAELLAAAGDGVWWIPPPEERPVPVPEPLRSPGTPNQHTGLGEFVCAGMLIWSPGRRRPSIGRRQIAPCTG